MIAIRMQVDTKAIQALEGIISIQGFHLTYIR
jgi:hypothetical protein